MIETIQQYFLPCMINMATVLYVNSKILNSKFEINVKNIVFFILLIFSSIINFIYITDFAKFLVSTIYITCSVKLIFKEKLHKTICSVIGEQIILFISELLYMLVIMIILKLEGNLLFEIVQGTFVTNLLISLISVFLINIKLINNFFDRTIKYIEKIQQKNKYILVLVFMITMNILLVIMYFNAKNITMVMINVVFIIIYSYVVYLLLHEKNENIKFKEENKLLLDNLNEYEKMLDYQRVANHENKNQLLVIKSIASKNNKKLHDYLDEVIKEKREDNETLYNNAKRIPSGGLQGLVYQKMLLMQEHNINLDLSVSKEVRKIELSNFSAKINFDLCRAIGIIIDNAIDEVLKLKQKDLSISMYKDEEYFIVEIANKCKELPNMERLDEKGYTTKENGHGYGLSLLKDICDKNKDIENERKVIENIFVQIIKVRI